MAHIRVADSVVLLHPFQGHRGTGNIPASTVANAVRQQRLVVELLEQEEREHVSGIIAALGKKNRKRPEHG